MRQHAESAEADAIGTEYLRAELLPRAEAETTQRLLRSYLVQRIQFFGARTGIVFASSTSRPAACKSKCGLPCARSPCSVWALMGLIAILCNLLLGASARHLEGRSMFVVLPLANAIAFFLIADIDSPAGGGVIHVAPQNLLSLQKLLR